MAPAFPGRNCESVHEAPSGHGNEAPSRRGNQVPSEHGDRQVRGSRLHFNAETARQSGSVDWLATITNLTSQLHTCGPGEAGKRRLARTVKTRYQTAQNCYRAGAELAVAPAPEVRHSRSHSQCSAPANPPIPAVRRSSQSSDPGSPPLQPIRRSSHFRPEARRPFNSSTTRVTSPSSGEISS